MTPQFRIRRIVAVVVLVAAWCALWGEVSVANLVSGLVVASAATVATIGTDAVGGIRIRPLLHFVWLVLVDLAKATVEVTREVLTPTDNTEEIILAVTPEDDVRPHLLLLTVAVTLTPGTAVIETDPEHGTLYLHLLHAERRDATEAHVRRLARLACEALPTHHSGVTL